jgi:hypothetical protein
MTRSTSPPFRVLNKAFERLALSRLGVLAVGATMAGSVMSCGPIQSPGDDVPTDTRSAFRRLCLDWASPAGDPPPSYYRDLAVRADALTPNGPLERRVVAGIMMYAELEASTPESLALSEQLGDDCREILRVPGVG